MEMSATLVRSATLATLPRRRRAVVAAIEWGSLGDAEAARLRAFGFDEGADVEVLHRSAWGQGPVACRVGRMTVALRRAVAGAVVVAP